MYTQSSEQGFQIIPTGGYDNPPQNQLALTIQDGLKGLGKDGLGLPQVLRGARPRVNPAVKAHLLQDIDVLVQLKVVVKVKHILGPTAQDMKQYRTRN